MTAPTKESTLAALVALAVAREEQEAAATALRLRREAFAAENSALIEYYVSLRHAVATAEEAAREALLASYAADPEHKKQIAPGGSIRETTVYEYDGARALAWATEKGMCLVPAYLDAGAFQKVATTLALDFVTVKKEPAASIAKSLPLADLEAALALETSRPVML